MVSYFIFTSKTHKNIEHFNFRVDWEETIPQQTSIVRDLSGIIPTTTESHHTVIGTLMKTLGISESATEATDEIIGALMNPPNSNNATTTKILGESEDDQRQRFVMMYAILMAVATYVYIHRTFAFFAMCLQASINLHDHIFRGISRATMYFYNNNPSGRILNRFSKDISSIDTLIPPALMDCLASLLEFIAIVVIVVTVNYWLLIPTIVMSFLFYLIRKCYINTARSVKRIESVSK